jgi:hypothetical protein
MGLPKTGYFDKVLETRREEKCGKQKEKIVTRHFLSIKTEMVLPAA